MTTHYQLDEYDSYFGPEAAAPEPEPPPVTVRNTSQSPISFVSAPGERGLQIGPGDVATLPQRLLDGGMARVWIATGTLTIVEAEKT